MRRGNPSIRPDPALSQAETLCDETREGRPHSPIVRFCGSSIDVFFLQGEKVMKKFIVAAASAVAVLGLAACSDTDETTTQGVQPPPQEQQEPMATPPATDQQQEQAPAN
jgi:hypothetical protein